MPVNTVHPDYNDKLAKWVRCRDAFAGQDAVKAKREDYLPRLGGQDIGNSVYDAYLYRAQFFNATAPTVVALTGAVFQKPMSTDNVPEAVMDMMEDVTLSGTSLEMFARELVGQIVSPGRAGILVDYPAEGGTRPHWSLYRAESIVNWRGVTIKGQTIATMVVLKEVEERVDPADIFAVTLHTQYRVLRLVGGIYQVEIWRENPTKGAKDAFVQVDTLYPTRRGASLDFIPFVFVGPENITDHVSDPPLLSLVDLNFAHYLTLADLKWGEHFTALPTPVVSGASTETTVHIGSTEALILDNPQAKAYFLEFAGTGLGSLRTSEMETRKMMASIGARLMENPGPAMTATEASITHSGETASLVNISKSCSAALSRAIQWTIWWTSTMTQVPSDALVKLSTDFAAVKLTPDALAKLMLAWQGGAISFETFFYNCQEGGIYPPDTTLDEEKARLDSEAAEARKQAEDEMKRQAELGGNLPPIDDGGE